MKDKDHKTMVSGTSTPSTAVSYEPKEDDEDRSWDFVERLGEDEG